MQCLLDTNVLLRALDRQHPLCRVARRAIIALRRKNYRLFLTTQPVIPVSRLLNRRTSRHGRNNAPDRSHDRCNRRIDFFKSGELRLVARREPFALPTLSPALPSRNVPSLESLLSRPPFTPLILRPAPLWIFGISA